ncbi:hypothetical protein GCM10011613_06700 [Cellvibrio zantedeschiae]|uniref:Uncharacterized protein n=1 Tax=Cellvibrio zantedeschiae TaxID=1237077 RepID=A0ABQ3ATJ6_9GAMM|nr:hypothetical protein GCM10011613_06700 [Cellvibrio zantedeschiae]
MNAIIDKNTISFFMMCVSLVKKSKKNPTNLKSFQYSINSEGERATDADTYKNSYATGRF